MRTFVHETVNKKYLSHYAVSTSYPWKKLLPSLLAAMISLAAVAQSYTTKADGNWSDPSIWSGGVVAPVTIAAGQTITIKHVVTFDVNSIFTIAGTVNITGTLQFAATATKDVLINAGGLISVTNGSFIQDISAHQNNLTMNGGRFSISNSYMAVGKNFSASNGAKLYAKNSKVYIGTGYSLTGTLLAPVTDTIQNSIIETGMSNTGSADFVIGAYCTLRVANAIVKADNGAGFKNSAGATISVLKGASNNYGFDLLKVANDLQNDGSWNARIDAACISGTIKGTTMADIDFTRSQDCAATPNIGDAPELIFKNPVLKSGTANKQGASYLFANVVSGVDAEITLKKFSRPDIQMNFIDRTDVGWDKAFQPNFGLPGFVAPNQNWYIDFQVKFYQAGTNNRITLPKVDITALDVDGDGVSIHEYAVFQNPSNVIYSTVSYLVDQTASNLGQTFTCPVCGTASALIACSVCGGDGKTGTWNLTDCSACEGTGLVYAFCNHPFDGTNGRILQGPTQNFVSIDTSATQVMATYQYTEVSTIDFRYGAATGTSGSNGAGIRLNSFWFRQFNLSPPSILPVKLNRFAAVVNGNDVNLTWTANEENVSHYIVQRSTNGKTFSDIALVFANNTFSASTYRYKDAGVSTETNVVYYRLLMVDKGKEEGVYSPVQVVRFAKEAEAIKLIAFPNPATEQVRVTLPYSWQGKPVMLQLHNGNGLIVQSMQIGSASQTETMQLTMLSKGFYIIKASCNGQVAEQRIIKN
jgi:hypothetical protein